MLYTNDVFFNSGFETTMTIPGVDDGPDTLVKVIFDSKWQNASVYDQNVNDAAVTALCRSSDVSGLKQGDTVEINNTSYTIFNKHENDDLILLVLE